MTPIPVWWLHTRKVPDARGCVGPMALPRWFWVTTAPNPRRAMGQDEGQRGWRLHAVATGKERAACGLRAAHGWGFDLFIDRECQRCAAAVVCDLP